MDILSRVFPVESAHMATLHAQSKKLSDLWALGLARCKSILLTCVHMEDVAQTLSVASSMALRLPSGWA